MSDVMFYGVLRMPYELAMSDELSRKQFYSRAQEAADRAEVAEKRIAELEAALASCYCHTAEHLAEILDLPAPAPSERQPDVSKQHCKNAASGWCKNPGDCVRNGCVALRA
jgi:hypothetical protein